MTALRALQRAGQGGSFYQKTAFAKIFFLPENGDLVYNKFKGKEGGVFEEPDFEEEKRLYPRYLIRVPLHIRGLNSRGENVDTAIEVVDISLEGLGFESQRDFCDGEILYVTLKGKNYSSEVNLQILWRDSKRHRYGARIISMASGNLSL
jgi:hypothetical protein